MFPSEWKKGNIVPIHKKRDKQNNKNYRPVSLLPNCGKIFEKPIFNEMFIYFFANKLISKNQSSFQPGDSCISQLLSITHETFTSFDNGLEVRSVFLDIFTAFDEVFHKRLTFKFKQNDISGEPIYIISDFLSNSKPRVVLMVKICHGPMFMLEFHKDLFYNIGHNILELYSTLIQIR